MMMMMKRCDGLLCHRNIGCIYFGIYGVYRKMSMMYM